MIRVSSSPHFHSKDSTSSLMLKVCIALLPSAIFGVIMFGLRALLVIIVSIVSSMGFEYLLNLVNKEEDPFESLKDYSALLTGFLIGLNMGPNIPIGIPIVASFFAIAVIKWTFGGLGCNWLNPAMGGRVFVFFSFTSAMSKFSLPRTLTSIDSVSSATTLSLLKTSLSSGDFAGLNPLQMLEVQNYPISNIAAKLSALTGLNAYTIDAFLGNMSGSIGEISALLLLLGGIYLIVSKVITWHIPVIYLGSYAILNWIFGGIVYGTGLFSGLMFDPMFRGGIMLGAIFMATDYVTSPITNKGRVIYALGCGLFTFVLRTFGSNPDSASLAIILMNIVTPTIDRYIKPKKFGLVKEVKK